MNKDFRITCGYFTHHKTKKLKFLLGDTGIVAHMRLLEYTAMNKPSGILSGMDDDDIAIAVDWDSEKGDLVEVLVKVRYLDFKDGVYSIHDWDQHNPYAAAAPERSEKARNAANARHHGGGTKKQGLTEKNHAKSSGEQCSGDDGAMRVAQSSNAPSPSPSPSPSPEPKSRAERASAPPTPAKSKKRKTQLDVEALPDDWRDYCREKRPDLNPDSVFEDFRDYWLGRGETMADWKRTWQRWVRNQHATEKSTKPGKFGDERDYWLKGVM